jgi:hypothetical protein
MIPHDGKQVVVNLYISATGAITDPTDQIARGEGIVRDSNFVNIFLWATTAGGEYANAAGAAADTFAARARFTNTSIRIPAGAGNDRYIVMLELGDVDGYYNAFWDVLTKAGTAFVDAGTAGGKPAGKTLAELVVDVQTIYQTSPFNAGNHATAMAFITAYYAALESFIENPTNIAAAKKDSSVTSVDYKILWFTAGQEISELRLTGPDPLFPAFVFSTAAQVVHINQFKEIED